MAETEADITRKIRKQRQQQQKNKRRGGKNVFRNTKGNIIDKAKAVLDFESLLGVDEDRRVRILNKRKKALDLFNKKEK